MRPVRSLLPSLVVLGLGCSGEAGPDTVVPPAPVAVGQPLTAQILEGQCQGLGVGTTAQAGATLQTAPTERARVQLSDGSVVVLDHESKLVLDSAPRQVRLEAGQGVFEVAHLVGGPPLRVKLLQSDGEVVVLGTKLRIREDGGRALVDVSRGEVKLSCPRGEKTIAAGQQGVMLAGSAPEVAAAPDLGQAMAWSEAGATDEEAGIGSLRARRPTVRSGAESELRLANHSVKVRISGPIARTEIEQTFSNDTDFELEGTYRFPLPSGARIASMALEVDGQFREGRFIDRAVGERIWRGVIKNAQVGGRLGRVDNDDILFTPGPWRDPALLAWDAGNRFSFRIFPIRPHSTRTVRLAYVETLSPTVGGRRYVYPLPQGQWSSIGRSVADRLSVDVRVAGHDAARPVRVSGLTLNAKDEAGARVLFGNVDRFVPTGNLVVEMGETSAGAVRTATYRDGAELFAVMAIRPVLPLAATRRDLEHVILLDSSYSATGELWRRQVAVAQSLVKEMAPGDRVTILTCDIGCRGIGAPSQVPTPALAAALGDALFRIEPGGTSDIVRAVTEGVRMMGAGASGGRGANLIYIGDGVATVGVRDPGRVAELSSRAAAQATATVSTIAVGTTCDERMLGELARRTGGVAIDYAPGDDAPTLALRMLGRLRGAILRDATVELPSGAFEVAPASVPAIHAGEEIWISAKYGMPTQGDVVLRGTIEGRPFESRTPVVVSDASAAGNAFVPAMWAERRALDLAAQGDMNREQIVALGTRFGLVTPFTSLIVLDSDALAERLGLGEASRPTEWTGDEEAELDAGGAGAGANERLDAPADLADAPAASREEETSLARRGRTSAGPTTPTGGSPARPFDRDEGQGEARAAGAPAPSRRSPAEERPAQEPAFAQPPPPSPTPAPAQMAPGNGPPVMAVPAPETSASRGMVAGGMGGMGMGDDMMHMGHGGMHHMMRPRIAVRVASIRNVRPGPQGLAAASQDVMREVIELRAKLAAEPDRRKHHRDLARLLARIGEVEEGTAVVRGWLARDAMDAEALGLYADMLARGGERERAVRALASVVEVQPGDKASQDRVARSFERLGRLEDSCAHRVTLAALSPSDDAAAAAATRCQSTSDAPAIDTIAGNLVVGARTDSGADVDLAVIFRDGTRVSFMGGKKNVRAAEAASLTGERLAIGFLPVGSYTIEVSRTTGTTGSPITGTLDLRVLGERRSLPFRLDGARVAAAGVTVRTEFR